MVYPLLKDKVAETQGLIAIMSQWQLKAEDLLPVIDKINKTADSYAVTSQDIVDGLNRVGAAAKNAGMTIEETIGAITVLREASGRTGKEVGTALNTIFSYMTRDKTIKLMEALGIRVFEDEARTTFRSIIELMEELAARWQDTSVSSQLMTSVETELLESFNEEMATAVGLQEEWNDMQQRDISQAAAGVRRKNFFISLMSRFSKIQEVVNNQLDAEGYSMRENERTMATLEKQIESLKAAAEQFAVAIGDAGLLDQMKGLVEGTADVIKWFNGLDDGMKTLIITFGEVAIAIKLVTSLMGMMGLAGAGGLAGGLLKGWNMPVKLAQASAAMITLKTATTATTTALRNLGAGTVAAFGGPWVLGITAAAAAVYTLYKNVQTANATMIEHGELAENMIGGYDSLVNKLSQLEEGTDAYNKTAEELRVTKGKIANALPEVIDGWDEETDSIKINREEMEKLITASKDLKKSQEDLTKSLEDSIRLMQEEVAEHTKKAQEWENEKNVLQDLVERRDKLTEALSRQKEGSEEAKKTEEALGETERLIADIAEEAGLKRNATVDEIIAKLNELKIAENQAVINTQTAELNKAKAVKEGSLARLAIIQQEIAAYNDPMSWGFMQAAGNFLKDINPLNRYNKDPRHLNLDNLKKERAESVKAAQEAKTQIDSIEKAIKESQRNIAAINADITPGGGPSPGPGAAAKGAGKEIDYLAEAIQRLTDAAKQYELVNMDLESVLDAVNRRLGVSNAEYDYLNGKVEAGTATAQDYARMQELLARKIALLKNEQVQLANANQEYQRQIESLTPVLAKAMAEYDRFKAAGDEKHMKDAASAVSALKSEIDSLSGSIASNTQKMWENKDTLANLTDSAEKSNRAIRDANIKSLKDEIDYLTRDGASQEELSRAYMRQGEYISLLTQKRNDLNTQIVESERILNDLLAAQASLNTATEEGARQYDFYAQSIASATSKLADLKSQQIQVNSAIDEGKDAIVKRNLAELDRLYKAHLMTLEQYIQALADLENQYGSVMSVSQQWTIDLAQSNSLLQKWTDDINSALEKARTSFEVEMKRIDEVVSQTQQGLSDFKDAITRIFDGVDKGTSRNFSKETLKRITGTLPIMTDLEGYVESFGFGGTWSESELLGVIQSGLHPQIPLGDLQQTLTGAGNSMRGILAGQFIAPDKNLTTPTPLPTTVTEDVAKALADYVKRIQFMPYGLDEIWQGAYDYFLGESADNVLAYNTHQWGPDWQDPNHPETTYFGGDKYTRVAFKRIDGKWYRVGQDYKPDMEEMVPLMSDEEAIKAKPVYDPPIVPDAYKLSKADFLEQMTASVEGLSQASTQIDDALANVDAWRESEVNRIDGLIEAKQLKLQQDIELLDGLFDQLDKSAQKFERTQTKERFQRSLNAAMGIESPIGVVPTAGDLQSLFNNLPTINLDNLMTFDPTNFKNAVTQGLTTLEDARQTATGYIQSLADSTKAQIAVIDAELKALDEESQKDTRGDAEEAHNKRLEELAEKRRYHEVRTGLDHVEAIADIDKQIAEENESWAKKQRDWGKEDKKAELQDKKASLQETQALLAQALQDLIGYINSEIQARKEATQEYKSNLQDQVQGEIKALNDEKAIAVQRAELLTEMLTGLKTFVTDALTQWKKLADDRVDIATKEVNDIIKLYSDQKETLKGIWEDNESGIRSMMQSGTLAQLAMMAALGKADGSAVQDLVNAITDKGIRENLQPIISRITGIAAPAPTPITPTPTPNPQPGGDNTHPDDGKTPATPWKHIANVNSSNPYLKNSNGHWYASREIWESPSMGYSVGWDAASKKVTIDGKAVSTIIDDNNKGYAQIREYFEGIGRTVKWNESKKRIDIYHEGGTITPFGRKPLLSDEVPIIARHNEMIFPDVPKYRVGIDFKRMQDTLEQVSKPNRSGASVNAAVIDKAADRIIKAIKEKAGVTVGKLVNVEHYEPQDSTDVEIFSREVMRRVAQL